MGTSGSCSSRLIGWISSLLFVFYFFLLFAHRQFFLLASIFLQWKVVTSTCFGFIGLLQVTSVYPSSSSTRVRLVSTIDPWTIKKIAMGSRLPNWMAKSSFLWEKIMLLSFCSWDRVSLYYCNRGEYSTSGEIWLVLAESSKSNVILPSLASCIILLQRFERMTNDLLIATVLWVSSPSSFFRPL